MGDISAEPSMEDILSSIKRIIAEEGESVTTSRARRTPKAAPAPMTPPTTTPVHDINDADGVLELRDAMPSDTVPPADAILSPKAAEASRGALDTLSRLIVRTEEPAADNTLEGLVREMIRPMLREWLDAKLPVIVEKMVAREITRITGQAR
jgi:cell pole-organizing protein PopZ